MKKVFRPESTNNKCSGKEDSSLNTKQNKPPSTKLGEKNLSKAVQDREKTVKQQ